MMSGCIDFQGLMQKSLDRDISQGEKALLDRHISLCQDCAREFRAFQLSLNMLTSMPVPEPAAAFTSETVKRAFKAKKILVHRQKVMSWSLSGLTVLISVLILASWNIMFQPALKWAAFNILRVLSEFGAISKALNKFLSTLTAIMIPLGDAAVRSLWQGIAPACYGYLIALMMMLLFILIKRINSAALLI